MTYAMKGESVQCTRSSSVDVRHFMAFIIRSILSFIAFISTSHRALLASSSQGGAFTLPVRLLGVLLSASSSS